MNVPEMKPEELRREIARLGPWFHNLDLGGVPTAPDHFLGDYPAFKWRNFSDAVPADLAGKTVLDIGCNAGFYSIEMKKRGAALVVGIDTDEQYLEQARFAADYLGCDIDFLKLSVYEVGRLGRRFDVVLFLGVLYHLRHPLLALDLIHRHVAGDILIFQSLLRGPAEVPEIAGDYPFEERAIFDRPGFPAAYFIERCYAHDPTNWWIPNRAGVEAMLRSSGFDIVEHPEDEVFVCTYREKNGAALFSENVEVRIGAPIQWLNGRPERPREEGER